MNKITHSRRNFIKKTGLTFLNTSLIFYFSSNSSKINGSAGNVTLNTNRVSKRYAFYNATEGWISL